MICIVATQSKEHVAKEREKMTVLYLQSSSSHKHFYIDSSRMKYQNNIFLR